MKSAETYKWRKAFKNISIIVLSISLLLSLLLTVEARILPLFGLRIRTSNYGISMEPTLKERALFILDEGIPFSDLQIGDIIAFKERTDAGQRYGFHNGTSQPKEYRGVIVQPGESVQNPPQARDEGITYTEKHIIHRIVDIRPADENHDIAYWTQGDNSSFIDNRVVMESGFEGKVIWYANGLGPIYDFLTLKLALPLLVIGTVKFLVSCVIQKKPE